MENLFNLKSFVIKFQSTQIALWALLLMKSLLKTSINLKSSVINGFELKSFECELKFEAKAFDYN